jgi:hypothetical protein
MLAGRTADPDLQQSCKYFKTYKEQVGRGACSTARNFATFQALCSTPVFYKSVVAVAMLNNSVVRIDLGRFCAARMHVVVEPCCSTSNYSLMQRNQLIKRSEKLGLPSSLSNL